MKHIFKVKQRLFVLANLILLCLLCWTFANAQQINISRIEKMPNEPAPYEMRNWKQVALGYDSLVFNLNLTGQYLPLVWIESQTMNYPSHQSFGLDSYVGTDASHSGEAINVLPAVISASLVGVDKRNQHGYNWVLMCEEFFNNRPSENVYLNNPVTASGSDWWYETMPNVFFYQLYDLYPGAGDFNRQFGLIANRWLEAVEKMGGSTIPWHKPFMNYRAWNLSTMTPLTVGVKEPEAAGAIAWILYNAYLKTGQEKYRIGAEWSMEFLSDWTTNPSYELQLPYGAYVAARMNAELGANYNLGKLVNWCFDTQGNVRDWGATVGNWGGYDCYGLIGEAKYAGYGFFMNGVEMAGALVPMVRYDERFARAIGKWMLNVANASRLYYSNYLPNENQDGEEWASVYDPHSYLAHEAIRKYALHTGICPYATGDAIEGGWAETNFALYGGSHVGIFGGIIDTTNVPKILKLDLSKTDYFQEHSFPSYLYFNPYNEEKIVQIEVGWGVFDLYDAVSNNFLARNVTGFGNFSIPGNSAVIVVLLPPDATITYELDKMIISGIVADYHSGQTIQNYPTRIKSLAAKDTLIIFGNSTTIYCSAQDLDGETLTYNWISDHDNFTTSESTYSWNAPDSVGIFTITCIVSDTQNGSDTATVSVKTAAYINQAPIINEIQREPRRIEPGQQSNLICFASDPDSDSLSYFWSSTFGTIEAEDSSAVWTAPAKLGFFYVRCQITDQRGGSDIDSVGIVVQDSSNISTGIPLAFYPFNGNAYDESGNDFNGMVQGAVSTSDRWGKPEQAYYFNGTFALIQIPNETALNFQDAITVSFWMKIDEFFSRESYVISHGSWQNRWKVSIGDLKKLRWTVNTNIGIKDLDSQIALDKNVYYNVTVLFDGAQLKIYINGQLDNSVSHTGKIKTTNIDLTIAQELPNSDYNFKGVLDDIRIYDYDLTEEEIINVFNDPTSVETINQENIPQKYSLSQNYPNPFNSTTTIQFQLRQSGKVALIIYDILGQRVCELVNNEMSAGYHTVFWDGKNNKGSTVSSGIYIYEMKCANFHQRKKLVLVK